MQSVSHMTLESRVLVRVAPLKIKLEMGESEHNLHVQRRDAYKSIEEPHEESEGRGGCRCRLDRSMIKLTGSTFCIAGAITTWIALAEKLQALGKMYPKFYFLTFWVHSFYSVLYLAWKFWRLFPGNLSCNKAGDGKLDWSFRRMVIVSGGLSIVAFISAYTWYLSLPKTPIPANTAIYQSAAAFVFIISIPLLRERVTLIKVLCVLMSIGGVTLVSFYSNSNKNCHSPPSAENHSHTSNDSYILNHMVSHLNPKGVTCSPEKSTPLGYVSLVVSVLTYAMLETGFKKFATAKDDPAALCNGVRLVSYYGVHTLLWMWPPLILLHYTKIEVFEWPSLEILKLMVLSAFLDVGFNGFLFVGIALSSPLFVSVGTILGIPISVIVDWLVQKYLLPWQAFIGIGLIVLGFAGFAFAEFLTAWREQKHEKQMEHQQKLLLSASSGSGESCDSSPLLLSNRSEKRTLRKIVMKYLI